MAQLWGIELSHTNDGDENGLTTLENSLSPMMLILHLPYDLAVALVRMYFRGRKHAKTYTSMFTAALFRRNLLGNTSNVPQEVNE